MFSLSKFVGPLPEKIKKRILGARFSGAAKKQLGKEAQLLGSPPSEKPSQNSKIQLKDRITPQVNFFQ
jgi:hypothetical protein